MHAAGMYADNHVRCCSDYAVSSYTPTLAALLNSQREISPAYTADTKVLLVEAPTAPGQTTLWNTAREISAVASLVPARCILKSDEDAMAKYGRGTIAAVTQILSEATVVHLACHGEQDEKSPLESGFWLRDGKLTIEQLMGFDLRNALFAYCSACETARGDMQLRDQTVHLVAAMLFVGFKSVIGTMWCVCLLFIRDRSIEEIFLQADGRRGWSADGHSGLFQVV